MKNLNNLTKADLMKSFKLPAIIMTLLVSVLPAHQIFGQKKTFSTSPCVDIAADGAKNAKQFWANQDFQPCKEALGSLRAGSLFALGENLDDLKMKNSADYRLQNWLMKIGQSPTWNAKFNDGLSIKDATDWLVENELIKDHDDSWRAAFINGIFDRIYGKFPAKAESDAYVAQIKAHKAWYAPIFLAEKNKLNQDPAQREQMINRAFQKTLNRTATTDEIKYWKPRTEIYDDIVAKIKK